MIRRYGKAVTVDKRVANNESRLEVCREESRKISEINCDKIQNVALQLRKFRDCRRKSEYVIIENVIDSFNLKSLCFDGKAENISFAGTFATTTRNQRVISNGQTVLMDILEVFRIIFPGCSDVAVKLLHSLPGDKAQVTHTDFDYNSIGQRLRSLKAFHYSALVAFEKGSTILMGVRNEEIKIPINGMIFWRGSTPHAGAAYVESNKRIFISIASPLYPVSPEVYIVK